MRRRSSPRIEHMRGAGTNSVRIRLRYGAALGRCRWISGLSSAASRDRIDSVKSRPGLIRRMAKMLERVRELLEATTCATVDPERNQRIESMARQLAVAMRHEGSFFHIHQAADTLKIPPQDILLVK